jgi:hypothetical protein
MKPSNSCMATRRGVMYAAVLPLLALSSACSRATAPPLVGAWRSNIQFESGAFAEIKDLEFMYVFNVGGTPTIQYEAFGQRGEPVEGGTARGKGVRIGL